MARRGKIWTDGGIKYQWRYSGRKRTLYYKGHRINKWVRTKNTQARRGKKWR